MKETKHNLKTKKGRLDYAKEHYPIGTKFKMAFAGDRYTKSQYSVIREIEFVPKEENRVLIKPGNIEGSFDGYIYYHETGSWAEIVKEDNLQQLKRNGLKEIYSVACDSWKTKLENYSKRNTFEDFIELSQAEVTEIFNACTDVQLQVVSKYLTRDDGIDLSNFVMNEDSAIQIRCGGEHKNRAFFLSDMYTWKIERDRVGDLCLIPTKNH